MVESESGATLAIGDLHLGNMNASIKDFLELLNRVKTSGIKVREIVFVGDFIDGLDKYPTQAYKQPPETLLIQREGVKWLVELISNEFPGSKIIFVLGNHDADFRGGFIDVELMERAYPNVKFAIRYIDHNRFLYLHMIGRTSRVGSQSGWTPATIDRGKSILLQEIMRGQSLRGLVTAHVHKVLDIVQNTGLWFILLPSFLKTGYETSEDAMFQPAIVAIDGNTITIYNKEFSRDNEVKEFNNMLFAILRSNRRLITRLDAALNIRKAFEKLADDTNQPDDNDEGGKPKAGVSHDACYDNSWIEDVGDRVRFCYGGKMVSVKKEVLQRAKELWEKGVVDKKRLQQELGVGRTILYAILSAIERGLV